MRMSFLGLPILTSSCGGK
ncbi:hypothetical protein LINPERPRIM_LOCUS38138 [Linum perenne]